LIFKYFIDLVKDNFNILHIVSNFDWNNLIWQMEIYWKRY